MGNHRGTPTLRTPRLIRQWAPEVLLVSLWLGGAFAASANFSATLQGQHFNDPTWRNGPLVGWRELDYVPVRVFMSSGPATNVNITINFDHTKGVRVGLENLSNFTHSSNVVITAGPTLFAPQGVDVWNYTLTVSITNNVAGSVQFRARLSAGDHLFPGSSLSLSGSPGLGTLQ